MQTYFVIHAKMYKLWPGQIRTDTRTHGRTDIHRAKIVTTMSRLPVSGLDKKQLLNMIFYDFKKIIVRYKMIGYNTDVMRQTACLVVNPINFAYLFFFSRQ